MFEVTTNGQVQHMTRQEIERTNFNQCSAPAAQPVDAKVAAALDGQQAVGSIGPVIVAVPRFGNSSAASTPLPADPVGSSKVVVGSTDPISTAGGMEMANRTGHQVTGLHEGALTGASEVTLIAHSYKGTTLMDVNGRVVTPQQLARELVDAGWRGGTLRLNVCEAGSGGAKSIAQQLANELSALKAESGIITAEAGGRTSILGRAHGLPQVRVPPELTRQPAGEGWEYVVAEPKVVVPPMLARGAAVAGVGLNVLNVIGTIKFAWDFAKMMEFGDSLRSGQYFKDFWSEVSSFPDGSRIKLDGEIGTIDMSKGISIHFKNEKNEWTIHMTSDSKGGFGMHITGTDHGTQVDYQIDKNGVRGGEVI
jgi:hypothetical protein